MILWREMEKRYAGNKYRGRTADGKSQLTMTVIAVNFGGDAICRSQYFPHRVVPQDEFLAFVKTAKLLEKE